MTTDGNRDKSVFRMSLRLGIVFVCLTIFWGYTSRVGYAADEEAAPAPLLEKGHPVDWWLVFKFNRRFPRLPRKCDKAMPLRWRSSRL